MGRRAFKWQELFNRFPRGIGVLEKDGTVLYGNDRLKFLFRREGDGLTPRSEKLRGEWESFFRGFLKGNEDSDNLVVVVSDNTGGKRWFSVKLTRSENDSLIFLLEEDVTEQHLYEQKLKKARDEAEKATRTKSEFLANMSHEIRTPIHTIIGMSELLNLTHLDQEQDEYGSQIRYSADVLLSLINDILDFSKIEAGQMELDCTGCDLLDLVEDSLDLIALEAHKKGVELGLHAEPGTDFRIEGDPVRLRQVAVNLTNNAVKFTREGQIMVRLERMEQDARSVTIRLSVKDSGIGIPEEKKQRLFEAFTQADSSTTRRFGGTGLGLTISKNLVGQMGGDLQVESVEGEGSEFYFTLTFPRSVPYRTVPESCEFGENLKGSAVLLCDDNPRIRESIRISLESWGCSVDEAGGGETALQMIRDRSASGKPYDLCILDQLMPGMDGWQCASRIRSDESLNPTALMLMSLKGGRGSEEAKMKLLGWFGAYLTKPVRRKELWDKCMLALFPDQVEPEDLEELEELDEAEEIVAAPVGGAENGSSSMPGKSVRKEGRILIAEDHPVNRKLFESILLKHGYTVILAENGLEALEKAEAEKPDLIFMDCQMPVMNGYEATRKIREKGLKIPVIAVTANAMRGEQEKCFKAGMNDFLPKPFKNRDLQPVLRNWLHPQGGTVEDLEVLEEETPAVEKKPVFDFNEAMDTFMEDRELLISLLEPYLEQVTGQLEILSAPGGLDDMEQVRGLAHSIKGSSRNLSMVELGDEAQVLEHAGRDGERDLAEKALPRVAEAFERVKKAVRNLLDQEG